MTGAARLGAPLAGVMASVIAGAIAGAVVGGCVSPQKLVPVWKLPPGFGDGSRVRVVAPRLGRSWQPGRAVLSTAGCWTLEVAVTYDPKAITVLAPGEVLRLQMSRAAPPPDWWTVPDESEGWTEISPAALEEANAPTCPRPSGEEDRPFRSRAGPRGPGSRLPPEPVAIGRGPP